MQSMQKNQYISSVYSTAFSKNMCISCVVQTNLFSCKCKRKGKAVPLQAWSGPEGSHEVKDPRLHDNGTGWW